ncbi:MAG TPA: class I SAM-dependent methyltransferase [Longimicrobium sp.]|nr:class I SAM-dependent methyltransferase [Longimicrobium sp.]
MTETQAAVVYEGRDLEAMSFARNYHRWIVDEIATYLGRAVAEVGAGSGSLSELLLGERIERLVAVEPSAEMYPLLARRLAGEARAETHHGLFAEVAPRLEGTLDSAVYVNVLEHVEDDLGELRLVHRALRPGGHVVVFVPALQWLYSDFDASIGHHRRYHREPLGNLLRNAGFQVERLHYFDAAGILPWLVFFRLMRRRLGAGDVGAYDRVAVPLVRAVETRVRPPLGKNLLAIGRKA